MMKWQRMLYTILIFSSGLLVGKYGMAPGNLEAPGKPDASQPRAVSTAEAAAVPQSRTRQLQFGVLCDADWEQMLDGPQRAAALKQKAIAVLQEKNPALRLRLFALLAGYLKQGDYAAMREGFAAHDHEGRLFPAEYNVMLQTMGLVDGEAVLTSLFDWHKEPGRPLFESHYLAMTAWAAKEPSNAIRWWNALPECKTKNDFARSLVEGVATQNVDLAWRCMQAFPAEEQGQFIGTLVRQQVSQKGPAIATKWLAELHTIQSEAMDPTLLRKGFEALYWTMPNFTPSQRSQYVSQFSQEPWMARTGLPERLAGEWARQSGPQAVAWATSLPKTIRAQTLDSAISAWARQDPTAADAWKARPENAEHLARP